MYTIISYTNGETLNSSFPICVPLILFCCLISLAKTSSTIQNRHWETGLVPDFSGITVFLHLIWWLLLACYIFLFTMFRCIPCIPDVSKTFIIKGCWILSNVFSSSNEMIIWLFSLSFMVDYIGRFSYVEPSLYH